jgi:hypothetical protein
MSNTIQIKRSSTANSVPTASQLAQGELAVNLVDKKLYTKDNTNAVVQIGGAPEGSFSFRNRIINGDMRIDQRRAGASFSNLVSNEYTLDRWSCYGNIASRFSIQRSTSSVPGFTSSLLVTSLAATSPGSTDIYILRQYIEGFNTADLAWGTSDARTVTVSFWVNSSVTGTFGAVVKNGAENRGYAFTYTVNAANTNEYKTITIPGDTTGAWATDNGTGIQLVFSLGAGSGALTTPGIWSAGNIWAASGQSNLVATNGATFRITGVQLEAGSVATPFERRPYGTELALCQRYAIVYGRGQAYNQLGVTGFAYSTTTGDIPVPVPVQMRDIPSLTVSGNYQISDGTAATAVTALAIAPAQNSTLIVSVRFTVASGATQFRPYRVEAVNSTTAFVLLSSEL